MNPNNGGGHTPMPSYFPMGDENGQENRQFQYQQQQQQPPYQAPYPPQSPQYQHQQPMPSAFSPMPTQPTLHTVPSMQPVPFFVQAQPEIQYMPVPEHFQNNQIYHLAPENIRPLYLSQFAFAPQQPLVQQEIVIGDSGNFVVQVPVSSQILKDAKHKTSEEFTHLRYTAVTCKPDDFVKNHKLRASELGRKVKVAIVCTMYNEDDMLFNKSLSAVFENIKYFCEYYRDPDWWKNIVVVIVSDGRTKINPRTLTVLAAMGCYTDGLTQPSVNGKEVTAHLFEYSSQICIDRTGRKVLTGNQNHLVPVQTIFLLKEKNAKKINSHRWFFNAICKELDPEVCILLDVGTRPTSKSFLRLWREFEHDKMVGGACGEIAAELGDQCRNLFNPLVGAQNFEYKMSNILDKPMESVFGFIAVLPGAFSAYRYRAIQGAPLDAYFKGEDLHGAQGPLKPGQKPKKPKVTEANMYLAEDRILCFEIVAKKNEKWLLRYVKDAQAETDVPDRLPELISQRRRWLNGSFFASVHAMINWLRLFESSHSFGRKMLFMLQFLYNWISLLFAWFAVGNFFLAFYVPSLPFFLIFLKFLFDSSGNDGIFGEAGSYIAEALKAIYLFLIVCTLVASLGNRPQGSKPLYHGIVIFFAIIMILMLVVSINAVVLSAQKVTGNVLEYISKDETFRDLVISIVTTYGVYLLASILHWDPWHCITSLPSYLLLLPSYVNILTIYAFCNIHDTSWGTKGDNGPPKVEGAKITTTSDGKKVAEVNLPSTDQKDVEAAYANVLVQLKNNASNQVEEKQSRDQETKTADYFKQFRTNLVILWVFCNAVLIYAVVKIVDKIEQEGKTSKVGNVLINPYLTFIFWSVAALGIFRFIFSVVFIVQFIGTKASYIGHRPEKRSLV